MEQAGSKSRKDQTRADPKQSSPSARVALVGIGQELRGDDVAGLLVVRAAGRSLPARDDLLIIEAASAPESFTGPLRRFAPDVVLLIDAADLGGPPGTVTWIDPGAVGGIGASTHTLPLHVFASYLETTIGCAVGIIGIQPASLAFDVPVSTAVHAAVSAVVDGLAAEL
jgi:hydrogenase maturation protease HycI